jgi:hypothetical protein
MRTRVPLLAIIVGLSVSCASEKKKDSPASTNDPPPKMLSPLVKKIWIPPAIKNGGLEWESGHYLYRIEREPTWSR